MNTMSLYLVESAACLVVFYGVYWCFMRRDTFFQLNRFYLLAAIIFSAVVPAIPSGWNFTGPAAPIAVLLEPVMITPQKVGQAMQDHLQWLEVAMVAYLTGVVIFLFRFGIQLFQVHRITMRYGIKEFHGQKVVMVDRGFAPFSFFNLVFINEAAVPAGSLPAILAHEQVHIRQHHTIDMILLELATVFQWFNPVIWLAGREMKTIHEYLADEGVLQNGISRPLYQQMILDETMGIRVNDLTNNFNISLLKKRIAMMTRSKSKSWAKSKIYIALPLLFALMFLVTTGTFSNPETANAGSTTSIDATRWVPGPETLLQDKQTQKQQVKYVAPVTNDTKPYKTVEKMPSYPGGDEARVAFLVGNIKYPAEAMKNKVQGRVFVTFIVRADGSVTDAKILRGIGGGCDEEALRVVKLMPRWNPGMDQGKPVDVEFNLPISFKLENKKTEEPKK